MGRGREDASLSVAVHSQLFVRRYRAALLDYLLGSGEAGLVRAYDLGRTALNERYSLLDILQVHQKSLNAVLESTQSVDEGLRRLKAAERFLMETLSPFEMAYLGYVELVAKRRDSA
jgi:hypothetical protein